MEPSAQLHLFGQFQLSVNNELVTGLTSEKVQALVAYLVVEQDHVHSREFLAELLWPDRPDGVARQNLRQALSRLQRSLPVEGEALLDIGRNEIRFNGNSNVQVDVLTFIAAVDAAHVHQHEHVWGCESCCEQLATAVNVYQGDFLTGLYVDSAAFDEWRLLKEEWLRREMIQALDILVQHHEARQQWTAAYRYSWRSIEIDPLREVAHQQVMRALAHSGRRNAALEQYATLVRLLWNELGVEPATTTTALYETIRDQQLSPPQPTAVAVAPTSAPVVPYHLPVQHTPFVGRQRELVQIAERLAQAECHLLTLVGPGGAGKTRLALEAAFQQLQNPIQPYPDGIYFAALAAVEDEEQLLTAIAAALAYDFPAGAQGYEERQTALLSHVKSKRLLLLLDNYEQLTAWTDLIVSILSTAPRVQLLVTSRVPLHLRAEWLLDIVGLDYPTAADLSMEATGPFARPDDLRAVATFEAVQLFFSAAQRVLADFTFSAQTLSLTGQLCLLTEGLPLALELAAAQIRHVPLPVLVDAVQRDSDTLATTMRDVPMRHRTLRAVFNHSWALLSPPLQRLFSRLAIFRGTFSTDAAIAVTGCTVDALDQLVAFSLLRHVDGESAAPRYALHEVLRQYALEQLQQGGDEETHTRDAHSHYYLSLVGSQQALITSADAPQAVITLQQELDNIRGAWQWASRCALTDLLQPAISPLLRYFVVTGQTEEGGHWADRALHEITARLVDLPPTALDDRTCLEELCAHLHTMRSRLFHKQARYALAIEHAQQALAIAEVAALPRVAATVLLYWSNCLLNIGAFAEAEAKALAALEYARAATWPKLESDALRALGILADSRDDLAVARDYYEESLVISQSIDDLRGTSASLGNVGNICRRQGDFDAARRFLEQSLAIHRRIGDRSSEGRALSMLGELSLDLEEYEAAEQYCQDAIDHLGALGEEHYVADALTILGKIHQQSDHIALARACWEEAALIYELANEAPMLAEVRTYLDAVQADGSAALSVEGDAMAFSE